VRNKLPSLVQRRRLLHAAKLPRTFRAAKSGTYDATAPNASRIST
jgi:hypothetical protein